ncbi:2-C-methyl-D-erythritol 4-phosphate cytidylyltransferase [Lentisphaerota bacterium ZTH]|nr:2-C-methyl-D-erythritol 4-phosphate cytidylyltransferase [Lentisphaerota bacterium]WET07054.1 2-C-methyl-D-erythritol 4-phosphate cytidylyltransferase [Lentisphaerota bacterium ZTH]
MEKKLGIIIAAAGGSSRFGETDKMLLPFKGLPLFLFSACKFSTICPQENIVIVCAKESLERFKSLAAKYSPGNGFKFAAGGVLRSDSVMNGLACLPEAVEFVAVHDAARPLASCDLLERCLAAARIHGGAVPAKPVTDTLKRTGRNDRIIETVCRNDLWRVETPQVFNLSRLRDAYQKAAAVGAEFTDDAAIMEKAGYPVYIINDPGHNLKVTFKEDVIMLEALSAED